MIPSWREENPHFSSFWSLFPFFLCASLSAHTKQNSHYQMCVGFSQHHAFSMMPTGVLQFNPVLSSSSGREHQVSTSGGHLCFWSTHCRSEVPITPSMGLNHLFWQVTGFREALTFTSLLKATIKRHRWTARWRDTQGRVGVSAPWHWLHPPPGTWMCPEPGSSLDITLWGFCGTFLCRHNQFVYYDASKFVTWSQTGEWDHHHLELMWKWKLCSPTK